MDPNKALENLREAIQAARLIQAEDTDSPYNCVVPNHVVTDIAEAFEALDEWLLDGGFFPQEWRKGRPVDYQAW